MKKTSLELKQGIKAHIIQTDKYKINMICVMITVPLTSENVTKNALLPFMLRRGTKTYPNQYILNRELDKMYGASFNCGIDKMGDNQILKFYINTIQNSYTLENEDILAKSIQMLLDIVFNPVMENEKWKTEFLETEKENLRNCIQRKIDDKDMYALERCITSMYGEEGFGIYKYGYMDKIEEITIENLTEYYQKLIQNSKIDIYLSGNFQVQEIKDILLNNENIQKLRPRIENYVLNNAFTEDKPIVENVQKVEEKMDVTQGKLVIGLDIVNSKNHLPEVAMVYNTILGDGANSMLFQNVREKASLAYSAKSLLVKQKSNIFIRCGIEIPNYEKALAVIQEQLDNMKNGKFTEEDIQHAKAYLIAGLKNVEEEQDTEIIFYIGQEIAKTDISLEEYMENIQKVTKDQILELARHIQMHTVYFLRD